MVEIVESIGLIILGALLTLVTTWILERIKTRKQKQAALLRLDQMISEVEDSVGHGHDFKHKGDWQKELDDLAKADRRWLGDLYVHIKRISWMIRDSNFDHAKKDASRYCCDELKTDLYLLQLELLPLLPLSQKQIDEKAKKIAHEVTVNWSGSATLSTKVEELVDDFMTKWRAGTLDIWDRLPKSSVWHTRKRS